MPVIIRGNFVGGGRNNVTLDDCTNISVTSKSDGIEIKWTDPQDIIFDGKTTAQWKGTKLVRKEGGYPTSEKDGVLVKDSTVRNEHSTVAFKDTGVTADVVYYYCLFPYTDKAITMSDNNRFTGKRISFDPVLKNNTWEQIAQASEQGIAPQLWQIGDEIDLTLSGAFNETVTLQIWDFNHFDKSDGTGKAGICFGMKHLMKDRQKMSPDRNYTGGWNNSDIRNTVMPKVLNSMPTELKNCVKEVNTYANHATKTNPNSTSLLSKDKVFIPGVCEVGGGTSRDPKQFRFPIFTDDNSRKKAYENNQSSFAWWWTRSYYLDISSVFWQVYDDGQMVYINGTPEAPNAVCFCFNV